MSDGGRRGCLRRTLGPFVRVRALVPVLLLTLLLGASAAGCRRTVEPSLETVPGAAEQEPGSSGQSAGEPTSEGASGNGTGGPGPSGQEASDADNTVVALVCGQPEEGHVLAYLPPGSCRLSQTGLCLVQPGDYELSPTGRYLVAIESHEEEPFGMDFRPVVYDIGALLKGDPTSEPIELVPSVPDYWSPSRSIWFTGWILGDQALLMGESRRVLLWCPDTGETQPLLELPATDAEESESVYHGGAVSPDGRSFALAVSGPDGMIRLEEVMLDASPDGIEAETLVTLVDELEGRTRYPGASGFPYELVWPVWAPDSLRLAVSAERRESEYADETWFWDAFVLGLDAKPPTVTPLVRDVMVLSWSPGANYLIVDPTRGGQPTRVISPRGETVLPIDRHWTWVQGSKGLLAYENGWSLLVSVPDGEKTPLLQGNAIARLPDGRWLWLAPVAGP